MVLGLWGPRGLGLSGFKVLGSWSCRVLGI